MIPAKRRALRPDCPWQVRLLRAQRYASIKYQSGTYKCKGVSTPEIRDEILEDATALGEMGFSPILGSATVAGSPATGSEGDFLSSGLAILKV